MQRNEPGLRACWVQIHLWLGLTLGVLGVLIGISGSLLVFDHDIDAIFNPQRYAVSGPQVALSYSAYAANAAKSPSYVTLGDWLDSVDYAVRLIGIDHVGLATDFNHGGGVTGYANVGEAENVTRALLKRGYSEADIAKLWGGNFLRVFREVEAVSARLQPQGKVARN